MKRKNKQKNKKTKQNKQTFKEQIVNKILELETSTKDQEQKELELVELLLDSPTPLTPDLLFELDEKIMAALVKRKEKH